MRRSFIVRFLAIGLISSATLLLASLFLLISDPADRASNEQVEAVLEPVLIEPRDNRNMQDPRFYGVLGGDAYSQISGQELDIIDENLGIYRVSDYRANIQRSGSEDIMQIKAEQADYLGVEGNLMLRGSVEVITDTGFSVSSDSLGVSLTERVGSAEGNVISTTQNINVEAEQLTFFWSDASDNLQLHYKGRVSSLITQRQ